MKTLILGMGNLLLCDDGIGIIIKRYLESILHNNNSLFFSETSWGGFRIIDILQNFDYVIVIDSIKTGKKNPGEIHYLKTDELLHTLRLNSYHDINFMTAIKLAEKMNINMPNEIDIFAVEISDNSTIKESISTEIQQSIKFCSLEIIQKLKEKKLIQQDFIIDKITGIENEENLKKYYYENSETIQL
jgi:hydrogenase maturation protease